MKPEYRFECRIVDETSGENIEVGSTYVSDRTSAVGENESVDMEIGSLLRRFYKSKEKYEEENYPKENKDQDE